MDVSGRTTCYASAASLCVLAMPSVRLTIFLHPLNKSTDTHTGHRSKSLHRAQVQLNNRQAANCSHKSATNSTVLKQIVSKSTLYLCRQQE